jgi:hypothetical protein
MGAAEDWGKEFEAKRRALSTFFQPNAKWEESGTPERPGPTAVALQYLLIGARGGSPRIDRKFARL